MNVVKDKIDLQVCDILSFEGLYNRSTHTHAVGVPLGERNGLELELEFLRQVKRDIRGNHDQLLLSFKGLRCTSILNPFELFLPRTKSKSTLNRATPRCQ